MLKVRSLLMSFLMVFTFLQVSHAKETIRDDFFELSYEKQAIVNWIIQKTKGRASEDYARKVVDNVYYHANLNGVDPLIVLGMITKESMFKKMAASGYGARGLMQVVPRFHRASIKNRDIYDISVNIEVGTKVLKYCLTNRKTFKGAMNCYSGGAKGYSDYVIERHKEIKQVIVLNLFNNDRDINVTYDHKKPLIQQPTFYASLI